MQAGNYLVGCDFEYEGRLYECASTGILAENPAFSAELLGALALTIIGLAVLAYFYYFKKE